MSSRLAVRWLCLGAAFAFAACCGPLRADRSKLKLPPLHKALDAAHDAIAAKGEGRLYAGAAMVDITTEYAHAGKVYLGGFDMGRKAKDVRDPVFAHVLYLDDGKTPLVLVTLDVIGFMNDDVNEVRALASDRHRERIVVASVHDHVGPDTVGYWGPAMFGVIPLCPGCVPEYMETMKALVASAIDEAAASARPARLRLGTAMADPTLSLNIHPQIRQQKDDLVRVVAVEEPDGKPIAVLANWGCHAEALWNDDRMSADWPGVFYRRWLKEVGGVPLFVEGALGGLVTIHPGEEKMKAGGGDIDKVYDHHMPMADRLAVMERVGNGLFDAVQAALKDAPPVGPEGVVIAAAYRPFRVEVDNWVFEYMGTRKLIKRRIEYRAKRKYMTSDVVAARVRAGGRVVLDVTSFPGEPAPTVVADLDAMSDAPVKVNLALGNDEIGYVVREADWNNPEYAYERSMSLGRPTSITLLDVIRGLRMGL
jgi:hypothetical protein